MINIDDVMYERKLNKLEFEISECRTTDDLEKKQKEVLDYMESQKLTQFNWVIQEDTERLIRLINEKINYIKDEEKYEHRVSA